MCSKVFTHAYSYRKHQETHDAVNRPNRCTVCGFLCKSMRKVKEHMEQFHEAPSTDDDMLAEEEDGMITTVSCTLCNSEDMNEEKMMEHLREVHSINDLQDWKSYINEVEFEMEQDEKPTLSSIDEVFGV